MTTVATTLARDRGLRFAPARRAAWRVLAALIILAVLAAAAWPWRAAILTAAADAWIVADEPLKPADAIVVLGGGLDTRPPAAAAYYRERLAPRILVANANVGGRRSSFVSFYRPHGELNRRALLGLGIPQAAIDMFGEDLGSTFEEAVALRDWAGRTHAHGLIVPSELFSARRVRWIFGRVFAGSGVTVQVPVLEAREYGRDNWWCNRNGVHDFAIEVGKYVAYRLRF